MKLLFIVVTLLTQFQDAMQQVALQLDEGRLKLRNFRHLHGHRLNVVPSESLELDKEILCTSICLRKLDCFSFNVKTTTNGKFLCDFLNTSKYRYPDNLTENDNYAHWYLQVRITSESKISFMQDLLTVHQTLLSYQILLKDVFSCIDKCTVAAKTSVEIVVLSTQLFKFFFFSI